MVSEFELRKIVNGAILKQFAGDMVSIMVRVEDVAGKILNATTTDSQKVRVNLPFELTARKGAWVEVIGMPNNGDVIRAKEVIEFGKEDVDFDTEGYNGMVFMLNNLKNIYQYG